jgi:hypothetical protein
MNPKIIDYELILALSEKVLTSKAKVMLKAGWQPFGAASIALERNGPIVLQAFVKYYEKNKKDDSENTGGATGSAAERTI